MPETLADDYGLSKTPESKRIDAPDLPYRPRDPITYHPAIGLIGCGGIAVQHLNAYRHAGYRVVALCDHSEVKALGYQDRFFPEAFVTTDYREILKRDEIEVVDIATHPADRVELIEASLLAGKHVLSQKPFVIDLDAGERLAELAERNNVKLAVNQNGRWAPHFSYMREAIRSGLIGEIQSVNFTLHWDHNWIIGTEFEEIDRLILYDFAIHWFDMVVCLFGERRPLGVYATATRAAGQRARPPMLAQALIEYDGGQASLIFNANVTFGQEDSTYVSGTLGSIVSRGPGLSEQSVTLYLAEGFAHPRLEGTWFREGFHGAMGELLSAIEEQRTPVNNARDNLRGLELCFAAIASSIERAPKKPGEVRRLPLSNYERSN
jgi:predicted dehydrogenase